MTWPRVRSRASRTTSTPSTPSSRRRARPRRSWPGRVWPAAGSATRAVSSSATRWSSRPPAGWPPSTRPTKDSCSGDSTWAPEVSDVPRYIGRIGLRDDNYDVLLIDWRAPAAAVFYQATQADPQGVVRRRILRSKGVHVLGVEDDLLDADDPAAETLPIVGEGALLAQLSRARDRSMHSIVATIQAEQDQAIRAPQQGRRHRSPAVRAPARPWWRCTARPTCSTATAVATRPAACSSSGPRASSCATSSGCCRRSARPRSRCVRSARSSTASARPGATSRRSPRSRDPLAMVEVLRRTARQPVPEAPRASSGCSTATT